MAKFVKSGPSGTSKINLVDNEGMCYYNSAHHGFQRAKAAIKRAFARKNRRTLKIEIPND